MLPLTGGNNYFRASFRAYYPIDMVHCGLTTGGMVVSAIAFLLFAALSIYNFTIPRIWSNNVPLWEMGFGMFGSPNSASIIEFSNHQ